jgi:hypothetical protein
LTGLFLYAIFVDVLTNLKVLTMNKLLLNCRPGAVFDPSNKEHRQAYYSFIKNATWGHSPYQFIVEPGFEDIPTMIRHRLCEYYVSKEFGTTLPPLKSVNKNATLTVVKLPKKELT